MRRQWHRVCVRSSRQHCADRRRRRDRRRCPHPPGARATSPCLRGYTEIRYGAKSWKKERRACARIEATTLGLDIRFVVTSLTTRSAEYIYDTLYCERGQAENLIKMHKAQLASDRTSCRKPLANQMRLILHTAAYWLMLTLRDAIPKTHALAKCRIHHPPPQIVEIGRAGQRKDSTHPCSPSPPTIQTRR